MLNILFGIEIVMSTHCAGSVAGAGPEPYLDLHIVTKQWSNIANQQGAVNMAYYIV